MAGLYAMFLVLVVILSTTLIFDPEYADSLLERLGLTGTGLFGSAEMYHLAVNGTPGPAFKYLIAALAIVVLGFLLAPYCKRVFG